MYSDEWFRWSDFFEICEDIPLDSEDYAGKNGYYTFQISVNCWNNLTQSANGYNPASTPNLNAVLNLIFIFDGFMIINNGVVSFNVGRPEGLQLDAFPKIKYPKAHELMRGAGLQAGSLSGSIFDVIREIPIVGDIVSSFLPSDKHESTGQQQAIQTQQLMSPAPTSEIMARTREAKKLGAGVGRWQ